jgi:hypothetical protein
MKHTNSAATRVPSLESPGAQFTSRNESSTAAMVTAMLTMD